MTGTPMSSASLYSLIGFTLGPNANCRITMGMLDSVLANIVASYPNTTDGFGQFTSMGTITSGVWNGTTIGLAYGGTGTSVSTTLGGVVYSGASVPAVSAATATASQFLLSGALGAPTWSTAVYPTTIAVNRVVYSSSANTIAGLATSNGGVLLTSASGVPSFSPTPTLGIAGTSQGSLTIAGLNVGSVAVGVRAAAGGSTFKLPATNGSKGSFLKTDGSGNTSWTSAAFPLTTPVNQLLYSPTTNQIAPLPTGDFGVLSTSGSGVPSIATAIALGTNGVAGGSLTLKGSTSGSATIAVPSATGNTTFSLPPDEGVANYLLTTDGNGNTDWAAPNPTFTIPLTPQGRLTLVSNTPVMTAAALTQGTVYYTPYAGNICPLWNGSAFVATAVTQLSIALSGAAASKVYDIFVWSNSGAAALALGPAWTNTTTRSAGTALARVQGLLTNSISISGGPAAGFGTYLGTIATDSTGATVSWSPTTTGSAAVLNIWNMYNRSPVCASVTDNGPAYSYLSTTVRESRGTAANQIKMIVGQQEGNIVSNLNGVIQAGTGGTGWTLVQSWVGSGSSTGTSITSSLPSTPTAGNLVVACYAADSVSSSSGFSVRDGNGNLFTQSPNSPSGSQVVSGIAAFIAHGASKNITFSTGGSTVSDLALWVAEFSGNHPTAIFDVDSGGSASQSITTNYADLVVSSCADINGSFNGSWTTLTAEQGDQAAWQIQTVAGSVTANPSGQVTVAGFVPGVQVSVPATGYMGIGVNSTSAFTQSPALYQFTAGGASQSLTTSVVAQPSVGVNTVASLEKTAASGTVSFDAFSLNQLTLQFNM